MAVRTAAGQVASPPRWSRLQARDGLIAVALGVAAAALRVGPLGPSSLWLDDAWTALVVRAESLTDAAGLAVTAPGFAVLLRLWLDGVGFSETAAQLPALAFAVAGPPAVYGLAVAVGLRRAAAALGAVVLVASPAHLTFASRVKPYTLDALLAVGVIGLAWRVVAVPDDRRAWAGLVGASAVATVLSAGVAPVIAAGFAAGLLAAWRRRVTLRPGLAATGVYAVAGGAWYVAFLGPSISPALRGYWDTHYIEVAGGPVAASRDLLDGLAGVLGAFSPLPDALVGAGLLGAALWTVGRRPAVATLLAGPLVVTVALAALGLAPLGGGRTDVYLLPGLALLAAVGADAVARTDHRLGAGVTAAVVTVTALAQPTPAPYPPHDVRPLVRELESALAPRDVVFVYSATRWAYGLYTGFDVAFVDDDGQPTGFDVEVTDPRVHILEPHRDEPAGFEPAVAAATGGAPRVWLIASGWQDDLTALERAIADQGFSLADRRTRPGGLLVRWDADVPPP